MWPLLFMESSLEREDNFSPLNVKPEKCSGICPLAEVSSCFARGKAWREQPYWVRRRGKSTHFRPRVQILDADGSLQGFWSSWVALHEYGTAKMAEAMNYRIVLFDCCRTLGRSHCQKYIWQETLPWCCSQFSVLFAHSSQFFSLQSSVLKHALTFWLIMYTCSSLAIWWQWNNTFPYE